jgi:hypothetical protein
MMVAFARAVAVTCFLAVASLLLYGALALSRPASAIVLPAKPIELGDIVSGEERQFAFTVTNSTPNAVTFIGAKSECGCLRPFNLPLVIEPEEKSDVELLLTSKDVEEETNFQLQIVLLTDTFGYLEPVQVRVTCYPKRTHNQPKELEPIPLN